MQLARRQRAGSSMQRAFHILALGPPTSLMEPLKRSMSFRRRASSSTESRLREAMRRPWCRASEQNEQPPPHPRWVVMLVRIISSAGTGSRWDGCARRAKGSAYSASISRGDRGGAGGASSTARAALGSGVSSTGWMARASPRCTWRSSSRVARMSRRGSAVMAACEGRRMTGAAVSLPWSPPSPSSGWSALSRAASSAGAASHSATRPMRAVPGMASKISASGGSRAASYSSAPTASTASSSAQAASSRARSPMPHTSRSALASSRMGRRSASVQKS